jgi:hypothetical protein
MYMPRTEDSVMVGDTPTEVAFGVYTRREIELMSIKKLSNCRTFDEFGHAEDGGLHDPAMGPASDTQVRALMCFLLLNFFPDLCHMFTTGWRLPGSHGAHRIGVARLQSSILSSHYDGMRPFRPMLMNVCS